MSGKKSFGSWIASQFAEASKLIVLGIAAEILKDPVLKVWATYRPQLLSWYRGQVRPLLEAPKDPLGHLAHSVLLAAWRALAATIDAFYLILAWALTTATLIAGCLIFVLIVHDGFARISEAKRRKRYWTETAIRFPARSR
ncbi:hypothetical protein ACEZDB_32210 [Streptacidiphilus sp. N1-3]|uniref:Uncharacterized protein n=1 Tax=Streptacidiphilus alkalitolerans TaxID=3342712 RepID=A0ABV6XBJ4_9ACTN